MDTTISLISTVGQSIAEQCAMFLWSIVAGGMIGCIYDVFRVIRKIVNLSVVVVAIEDILFFMITTVIVLLHFMEMTGGQIRWFSLVGMLLGAIIYFLTMGKIVMKTAGSIIILVKKIINLVARFIKLLFSPIIYLLSNIAKFFTTITVRIKDIIKKAYLEKLVKRANEEKKPKIPKKPKNPKKPKILKKTKKPKKTDKLPKKKKSIKH